MAGRGWARTIVAAVGIAAGAGAAQLGLCYGLGIVSWMPSRDQAGEILWLSNLVWVLWIAATATAIGAICATRLGAAGDTAGSGRAVEIAGRIAVAVAAAIGALVTVALVMLPARSATQPDNFQPQVTAAAYAVVGVVAGLVVAVVAVNARAIAANVLATAAWLWALAVVSVVDAVGADKRVGTAQLAAWQFIEGGWFRSSLYLPGALLMLGGALLVGVVAALPADRRGDSRIAIAVSGAVGPLLVAAAYFVAVPRLTLRTEQLSAYIFAPYAVIAGLAGSALVAAISPVRPRRSSSVDTYPDFDEVERREEDDLDEPTLAEWTPDLAESPRPYPDGAGEEGTATGRAAVQDRKDPLWPDPPGGGGPKPRR